MATITYTVTVASGTNQYGTGNKFYINGTVSPDLNLVEGNTYIFDQSDSTNGTHYLAFSTSANNSPAAPYTTGVTTTGTPGSAGAKTTIVVAEYAPTLYYYCTVHSGMGATAYTIRAGSYSDTTTFESTFYISDIIEEAYERIGIRGVSGYQLRTARRSLNIMFQEWGNRGLHYWEIGNNSITLVNGQKVYTMYRSSSDGASDATAIYGVDDILEASYRNSSNVDTPLTKINRSTYQALSNKSDTGTPTQYFVQRFIDKVQITLYLTPGSSQAGDTINYYYVKRIQDAGDYTNQADVPYRFVPCMTAGLAYYLAMKFAPDRIQVLKMLYEDELNRALVEDGSSTSSYITPKTYYPGT